MEMDWAHEQWSLSAPIRKSYRIMVNWSSEV